MHTRAWNTNKSCNKTWNPSRFCTPLNLCNAPTSRNRPLSEPSPSFTANIFQHSNTNPRLKLRAAQIRNYLAKAGDNSIHPTAFTFQPTKVSPLIKHPQHCTTATLSMAPSKLHPDTPGSTREITMFKGKGCISQALKDSLREQTKPQRTSLAALRGVDLCWVLWECFRKKSRAIFSKLAG